MGETIILEGMVAPDKDSGKVYLFSSNGVIDLNKHLQKLTGEVVTITIVTVEP